MSLLDPYTLLATSSLIIQLVVFGLLIIGYYLKKQKKFRRHGFIMTSALLLHLITILAIMIPSFVFGVIPDLVIPHPTELLSIIGLLHGITGLIALALGIWFIAAWRFKKDLSSCFKKKQPMRYAITIWVISLALGVYLYILFYGSFLMTG